MPIDVNIFFANLCDIVFNNYYTELRKPVRRSPLWQAGKHKVTQSFKKAIVYLYHYCISAD